MVKSLSSLVTKTCATSWHHWLNLAHESSQKRLRSAVLKIDSRAFFTVSAEMK